MTSISPSGDSLLAEYVFGVRASCTGRNWLWRRGEDRVSLGIAQKLGVPEVVGRLLAARAIDLDAAADFLTPTLRASLPDPSLLLDMDAAAERLAAAVRCGECVAIFGDYDVDGACSGALLALALRSLGCRVLNYVPDRLTEGYGPNAPALSALADRGASLVVCVDCGTAAAGPLATLAGRADVVVLDHHVSEGAAPPVVATVNPNRLGDRSNQSGLCAAAVTFLAVVALVRVLRRSGFFMGRAEPDLLGLLDLVALATVCDVMPLTGVNRALVCQGLKVLARRERPGIAALLDVAQTRGLPNAATLGYALGPRINAAGRISQADLGLRLLMCEDPAEAQRLAVSLDAINRQRQAVESSMLEEAYLQAASQVAEGRAVLMVAGAEWHPGVVGIVAGRIKERYNRPTCVAGLSDGIARGSGRSVPGHDLGAAVIKARQSGILLTGGGHAMAAGFSLSSACLGEFSAFLNERLSQARTLPTAPDLVVEASLTVSGATLELAEHVSRLAPFGRGNEEPVFVLPHVRVARADRIGTEGTTIRAFIEGEGGGRLKAMLFRASDGPLAQALLDRPGPPLHLCGHLRAETWNNSVSPAFFIADVALA
jgi:single-stranded-DNA-specific exonuclease